jgi:hypothetical protein
MGTGAPVGVRRRGLGLGWDQVALALAAEVPVAEIDRIWLFAPLRQEGREWGTAVVLRRLDGERRRVYTATYMIATRSRERGRAKINIDEVGDSPTIVVEDVIAGVRERSGDAEPPTVIAPHQWFGEEQVEEDGAS